MQLVAVRVALGVETGESVETDGVDHDGVTLPFRNRLTEPCRVWVRGVLVLERDDIEPVALLEEEREVLVVLHDLEGIRRVHRSHESKWHAHPGVVAVLLGVVRLDVLEPGRRVGQWPGSLLEGRVPRVRTAHVRHVGMVPHAAEIDLAIGQPRSRSGGWRKFARRPDRRFAGDTGANRPQILRDQSLAESGAGDNAERHHDHPSCTGRHPTDYKRLPACDIRSTCHKIRVCSNH